MYETYKLHEKARVTGRVTFTYLIWHFGNWNVLSLNFISGFRVSKCLMSSIASFISRCLEGLYQEKMKNMPSMNIALLSSSLEKHFFFFFKFLALVHIYGIVLSDQVLKWMVAKSENGSTDNTHCWKVKQGMPSSVFSTVRYNIQTEVGNIFLCKKSTE